MRHKVPLLTNEIYIYRGERTASAMESQLTSLERKIDELLAATEEGGVHDGDNDGKASHRDAERQATNEGKKEEGEIKA